VRRRGCASAFALACALGALAAPLAAGDWSRFRGPNGSGVADGSPLPASLDPAGALWKVKAPRGYSSPILFGERLFLTAFEADDLLVLCLARDDGRELWRRVAPRPRLEKVDERNGPASPSVAVDAERVVVFFADYGLLAFDHAGRELWRTPLGPFDNVYGMGASPILAGGLVVLACDQSRGSFVAAFDAKSGRERWRAPRPEALSGHATPVVLAPPGARPQLIVPGSFRLDAYDLESGASVWFANGLPSEMKSGAVLGDGTVYVVGYSSPLNEPGKHPSLPRYAEWVAAQDQDKDGKLTKAEADRTTQVFWDFIDLDRDGSISESEWHTNEAMMAAENGLLAFKSDGRGDVTRSGLIWTYRRSIPQLPTPVLYRGVLYMINDGGILTTLDPQTGAALKQGRLRDAVDQYFASPVAGDGKVYFVSKSGIASVIKAGPEQEAISVADLAEEVAATPALADGRIYLRTRSTLYCFAGGTPTASPPATSK
jgi:outer membrane protein assembly factor BamB